MGLGLEAAWHHLPSPPRIACESLPDQDGDQNHEQGRAERRGLVDLSGSEHSQ